MTRPAVLNTDVEITKTLQSAMKAPRKHPSPITRVFIAHQVRLKHWEYGINIESRDFYSQPASILVETHGATN